METPHKGNHWHSTPGDAYSGKQSKPPNPVIRQGCGQRNMKKRLSRPLEKQVSIASKNSTTKGRTE
ncbi:hypothetical protein COLO4_24512 [Corchorus olitorius]|uniref:Uncharacterized protein n=1 Tax=Corchorus olitorius TaxID=93759 RepID=A0A1R3I9D8_9ROSI|nr:hypothetical protein COLO4_24512 [Corchorus olitorius]